jgi:hypothetical protein
LLPLHVNHEDQSFLVQEIINGYDYERLLLLPRLNEQKPIKRNPIRRVTTNGQESREKNTQKKKETTKTKNGKDVREQTCI